MTHSSTQKPDIINQIIDDGRAWIGSQLRQEDWFLPIPPHCIEELQEYVDRIRSNRLREDFPFLHSLGLMRRVQFILDHTVQHVVLDRLPIENWSQAETEAVFWKLGSLLGRPVQQKWTDEHQRTHQDPVHLRERHLLYDVKDSGATLAPDVRRSVTNIELTFHNDNCFNAFMPKYVSLLCLNPGLSGGISRLLSFYTVHNILLAEHSRYLERLYQLFWFNRQGEHSPEASKVSLYPVFTRLEELTLGVRCNTPLIRVGHELASEPLDQYGDEALQVLEFVMSDPELWNQMDLQRGQIQFLNNRETGHARTEFVDGDTPESQRHLLRLWIREEGSPSYEGLEARRLLNFD